MLMVMIMLPVRVDPPDAAPRYRIVLLKGHRLARDDLIMTFSCFQLIIRSNVTDPMELPVVDEENAPFDL